MSTTQHGTTPERTPLSRDRVLAGAMTVADATGIAGLTMRSLADELGVKPMSLYHHVANKDEILDGIVDVVFGEIVLPTAGEEWRTAMRERAVSARAVLREHPWAITLMESRRRPGPANLRHHEAVLGVLRVAGFSVEMAGHAYALLDSYVYGFALQEAALPFDGPESVAELAESILEPFDTEEYPHLTEMMTAYAIRPDYAFGDEFEFGLDLVLDGLEQRAALGG